MNIALIGYGKMGHMIEEIARRRGHTVVSIIDVDNHEDFASPAFATAQVAIEFTTPTAAYANYLEAWRRDVKVVSGSTGWMAEHEQDVRRACLEQGHTLFWSSNFSLGMALFRATSRYLARLMNGFDEYDVHIEETHHVHKLDAPSGTAITLAEDVCHELERKEGWARGLYTHADGRTTGSEQVADDQVRIDSVRRGEVPGIHSVCYDSPADSITLTHDAHSRRGFALGAVLAAEFTARHSGLLTMNDLFPFLK